MKNIYKFILVVSCLTMCVGCDAIEDRLHLGGAITADQLNISATPVVVNGKNSNKVILENHSPVLSSWDYGVGITRKSADTILMVVEGESEILFTGLNPDGTTIEKTVKVNIDELTFPVPPEWGFLTDGVEKVWSWDSTVPAVWGNGGYLASRQPAWWAVALTDLNGISGVEQEGEGATMTFELRGAKLTKLKANGESQVGTFSFDMTKKITLEDGSVWAKGLLTTKGISVLGGYSPNEKISVYEYEILVLDGDQMVLCHPEAGAVAWGTAWYWMFRSE